MEATRKWKRSGESKVEDGENGKLGPRLYFTVMKFSGSIDEEIGGESSMSREPCGLVYELIAHRTSSPPVTAMPTILQ